MRAPASFTGPIFFLGPSLFPASRYLRINMDPEIIDSTVKLEIINKQYVSKTYPPLPRPSPSRFRAKPRSPRQRRR